MERGGRSAFDPCGRNNERKMGRGLPDEHSAMSFRHLDAAKPHDWPRLAALARSAELVRGYGHIKEANVAKYRAECKRLEGTIGQPVAQAADSRRAERELPRMRMRASFMVMRAIQVKKLDLPAN